MVIGTPLCCCVEAETDHTHSFEHILAPAVLLNRLDIGKRVS